MLTAVIIFIIVLAILVVVHEFGHFFVARKCGVKVEEFGFGFPPRLWAFKGKICEWSVNWLPFGGFVKMKGEDGVSRDSDSFAAKGPWKRAAIVFAGPLMNFVLAAVLFSLGFMMGAPQLLNAEMPEGAKVTNIQVEVVNVIEGSLAEELGLVRGDVIAGVNNGFARSEAVTKAIRALPKDGGSVLLNYRRDGDMNTVTVRADQLDADDPVLGLGMVEVGTVRYGVGASVVRGFVKTCDFTKAVVVGLYGFFKGLFVGAGVSADVAGPVGIAAITGEVMKEGFAHLVQFVAILSVNLGVLNLIPFPALDGGRLLFIGVELLSRRPISRKIEQTAHVVGFALLMILILVVTAQDISRFITF